MAQGKKSVLIYVEWMAIFEELEDSEAGKLIKHLFRYVNDLDPEPPDRLTKLVFEPIKQQLKRDLQKWESKSESRSESGRLGGIKSGETRRKNSKQNEANEAIGLNSKQNEANEAVKVKVKVEDKVKVKEKRKIKVFVAPLLEEVKKYFTDNGYSEAVAERFFKSYSVADWVDTNGRPVINWKQKAINVWFNENNKKTLESKQITFSDTEQGAIDFSFKPKG